MTINREAVALHLATQFSNLASLIGQNATPLTGFAPDIDDALRRLGYAEVDLATAEVEDVRRNAVFALASYYAARRLWRQLSDRVNIKVDDSTFDYKNVVASVQQIMQDAARACRVEGFDVSSSGWAAVDLNLGWAEPRSSY